MMSKTTTCKASCNKNYKGWEVPWVIGGDWNQEPGKVTDIWEIGGEIARTGTATHDLGSEIDWFMVSNAIRGNWEIAQGTDQAQSH